MDLVEVGGLQIAYERVGQGPTLVLLHGYVGDGPTTWRQQLDGLSDAFTVVAWDAPGAGRSGDPPEGTSASTATLRQALAPGRWDIRGVRRRAAAIDVRQSGSG